MEPKKYMVDLSIVIVNWNTKKITLQCIKSIYSSKSKYISEIILVDNNSSDDSVCAIEKMFPEIKIIVNDKNFGFAKANNIGFSKCLGRYICIINSDTEVKLKTLNSMISFLDKNLDIGMLGPRTLNKNGSLMMTCRDFPSLLGFFFQAVGISKVFKKSRLIKGSFMTYFKHDSIRRVDVLSGSCMMVKKQAFDEVGGLDERFFIYGEDVDWCKRFNIAGWPVVFYPYAEIYHYSGSSSSVDPQRFSIEMLKASFQYCAKYFNNISQYMFYILKMLHYIFRLIQRIIIYCISPNKRIANRKGIKNNLMYIKWIITNKDILTNKDIHPKSTDTEN